MGNYISCRNLSPPMMKTTTTRRACRATRVILPGGEIRLFREPVKAAEIMLESPNCFLADSKCLIVGKRFSALPADQDLEFGNVYILFPMKRLKSVVAAADVAAAVLKTANTMSRRISGGTKVKPIAATTVDSNCVNEVERSRLSLEEIEGFHGTEYRFKIAACRSRKPLLDTIAEEPLTSR